MTKDMIEHQKFIEEQLKKSDGADITKLFTYHKTRMRDFQHERLIHLIVTAFVAIIMVLVVIASVVTKEWLFFVLDMVLIPLVFAYLIHYRSLENGVQSLYELTKQLGKELLVK